MLKHFVLQMLGRQWSGCALRCLQSRDARSQVCDHIPAPMQSRPASSASALPSAKAGSLCFIQRPTQALCVPYRAANLGAIASRD